MCRSRAHQLVASSWSRRSAGCTNSKGVGADKTGSLQSQRRLAGSAWFVQIRRAGIPGHQHAALGDRGSRLPSVFLTTVRRRHGIRSAHRPETLHQRKEGCSSLLACVSFSKVLCGAACVPLRDLLGLAALTRRADA
jgi:hypothetical protein